MKWQKMEMHRIHVEMVHKKSMDVPSIEGLHAFEWWNN